MTCVLTGVYRSAPRAGTVRTMSTTRTLPATPPVAAAAPSARGSAVPPLLAAGIAVTVAPFVPLLSPLLLALVIGVVVANSPLIARPVVAGHGRATQLLLRLGVAALGLQLPVADIISIGPAGLAVIAVTVAVTFRGTLLLGRRLGLDEGFVVLLSAGFSICGAAAIAAVASQIPTIPGATRFGGPVKIADGVLDRFIAEAPHLIFYRAPAGVDPAAAP